MKILELIASLDKKVEEVTVDVNNELEFFIVVKETGEIVCTEMTQETFKKLVKVMRIR